MAIFSVSTHHAYLNNTIVLKAEGNIIVIDTMTQQEYEFDSEMEIHLSAGRHVLKADKHEEVVIIEDAIKLGGSEIKKAFVFDNSPFIFVTMRDRLYMANVKTQMESIEYGITPDDITNLSPLAYDESNSFFLFKTQEDFAIYDALKGCIIFKYTGHIYANRRLVIFKKDKEIKVYDYHSCITIASFDGQYSFGSKFYYVKDKQLYGLNLNTAYINMIPYVGNVDNDDILYKNSLLKLELDLPKCKNYLYIPLGNGEREDSMSKTKLTSTYYIEKWCQEYSLHFIRVKEEVDKFRVENNENSSSFPNVYSVCFGVKIIEISQYYKGNNEYGIKLYGEIISYPAINPAIPFVVEGSVGGVINLDKYIIKEYEKDVRKNALKEKSFTDSLNNDERVVGKSESGELLITQEGKKIFLRNSKEDEKLRILENVYDTSNYVNAYFTSDGRNLLLKINDREASLFGFDSLKSIPFEIDGFTLAKNEGCNGYQPELISIDFSKVEILDPLLDCRRPVWRDPITLNRIHEDKLYSYEFRSPDGKYTASTRIETVFYNRLKKAEVTFKDVSELRSIYDWDSNSDSQETDKKKKEGIVNLRKELSERSDRQDLFGKLIDYIKSSCDNNIDEDAIIENYIMLAGDFVSLFIDRLGYVNYWKTGEEAEKKRVLIGRSVYFLNYVSFSYDSRYLSFAAKMNTDLFRRSQKGVCEIFNLETEEIVNRIENSERDKLRAVWMSMFSKSGDVAFYDSSPNAYLAYASSDYKSVKEAENKSLLCFSPSGKYIAFSNQGYITYASCPDGNWGHQPSGNVFIHAVEDFSKCIEQYNDLGSGVSGVANRALSVASAAFSQDETRFLVVGNDGVVVIRNLKLNKHDEEVAKSNNDDYNDRISKLYDAFNEICEGKMCEDESHFEEFTGSYAQDVMGYSDEIINDAFDGDSEAYWNID